MKEYIFSWETKVQRSVSIPADSKEEAYEKWMNGNYGLTDVDDEDMIDDVVDINGEIYSNSRFERIYHGNERTE